MRCPNISRRDFLKSAAAGGAWITASGQLLARGADQPQPNIVYIMSDQQHWQALGCVDPFFETPHLDQFASDAALFERAFCSTPQCSPSRSSMMTGLYPSKTGVMGNVGAAGGNRLARKTIGAMLQEAGYHTAYFGKWHLGDDPTGNAGWNEESRKQRDPQTTVRAVEFLGSAPPKQPFGLVVSYLDPHDVYQFRPDRDKVLDLSTPLSESWLRETFEGKPSPQKKFMTHDQGRLIWGAEKEVWQAYREFYRRKVRLFDEHVGKVLAALRQSGLWENTVVIISSDHGDMDANHRLIFKGPFMYEHMMRIPLLVRVPEALGGVTRGRIAGYDTVNVDLVPTIRDFAGLAPIQCDGLSLKPILTGARTPPRRDFVIGQYYSKQQWVNPIRTIRTPEYKYNRYVDHGEELYDLINDPHEIENLAGDPRRSGVKQQLAAQLDHWIRTNDDPFDSLNTTELKRGYGRPNRRPAKAKGG